MVEIEVYSIARSTPTITDDRESAKGITWMCMGHTFGTEVVRTDETELVRPTCAVSKCISPTLQGFGRPTLSRR